MKDLCYKTWEMLRMHPILWVPYLAADLLAIGLWRLRGAAEKGIFRWFSTYHSVFGGDRLAPNLDHAAMAKASLAYAPIGFATIFLIVCLFVIALVVTAGMVNAILREQKLDTKEILAGVSRRGRRILLFSLTFLLTIGVVGAGALLPVVYLLIKTDHLDLVHSTFFVFLMMPAFVGGSIWLVVPMAIRLIDDGSVGPFSSQARNWGAMIAIIATEIGAALSVIAHRVEAGMVFELRWEITALSALNSILANGTDALVFVALALLAAGYSGGSKSGESRRLLALLRALMPLHFGERKEP